MEVLSFGQQNVTTHGYSTAVEERMGKNSL